jgi:hypothetical protein
MSRAGAIVLLLAAACAPATAGDPTWLADVRPILVANCVRCHGYPAIGGAPSTFRLDVYEDTTIDGRLVRGAAFMDDFIAARASDLEDMPPRGVELSPRQKDVLAAWPGEPPALGSRAGNRPPTATLLSQQAVSELAELVIAVDDPDGDLVFGEVAGVPLRPGRQTVELDLRGRPGGEVVRLEAELGDGEITTTVDLGSVTVPARANTPPRFTFSAPARDALLRAGGAATVAFTIVDPDAGDDHTLELEAFAGARSVTIVEGRAVGPGDGQVAWSLAGVPALTTWRIRATLRDGVNPPVVVDSPQFIVSDGTTTETAASIAALVDEQCEPCHGSTATLDFEDPAVLRERAGLAWRKVVQLREMPPPSARALYPTLAPISEADRARLGAWLYAGAPP